MNNKYTQILGAFLISALVVVAFASVGARAMDKMAKGHCETQERYAKTFEAYQWTQGDAELCKIAVR
jgi:hypothetical protein